MRTFALAPYPLSGAFRTDLERLAGGPVELAVLPELRRLGPAALMRRLRSLRGRCLLPLEDPGSAVLLPILQGLAAATRAGSVEIVDRDLRVRRSSRAAGAAALARLAGASVAAQTAVHRAGRELDALLSTPRRDARPAGDGVLYLNANLWFGVKTGGSVAHVAGVVNALVRRGRRLTLATVGEPVGVTSAATVVPLEPPRTFGLPVEGNLYRLGRAIPGRLQGVARPGLVYQRHSVGSYAGVVLARRSRVPLVLEYNGSEVWVARNWGRPLRHERLALRAEEASLRHAHLVVTVSRVLADELERRGVDPARVVWHPNGVDADAFDPRRFSAEERSALRRRHGISDGDVLATFVGTFGQWHGVDLLGRAIARHAARFREAGLRFLIVGDGLKMPEVRRELEGLDDLVVLTGLVPQVDAPRYLAASDVLVSPHVPNADGSLFFGSPTKLFEYMAAGKAIVASDLDQIGEVLRDDLAVLVTPGDEDDLARGLVEAAADADLRRRLGERARGRVLERYTWDDHVDAILRALDAVPPV